jgi:uncharacterized protein (TIGR02147 family)
VSAALSDYRDVLQSRFEERHRRNPAYSLRAFARDLKLSPSRLCEVLSRRHHLSAARGDDIARRLELPDGEREQFRDLIEAQAGRTARVRAAAAERLARQRFADAGSQIALDRFAAIADWYHLAIIELFKVRGFRGEARWIAARLGLKPKLVREALARLCRLGFLAEADGGYVKVVSRGFTDSDTPSRALHTFQQQILARASEALIEQPKAKRVTLTAVAAIGAESIEPLRAAINDLVSSFVTTTAKQSDADGVHCLTVQLFQMDRGDGLGHETKH